MNSLRVFLCMSLLWGCAALARGQTADANGLVNIVELLPQHHAVGTDPALTFGEIEQMALLDNPDIRVAARRLVVVEAHVPAAGALDDPILGYRGWGTPLSQPWNYNAAQNMFMLSQTFPGFGKRVLRSDIARTDVIEAKATLENMRLEVRVQVRRAFYDLLSAQDELRIHDEHVAIARQAVDAARIKYTVGKVPQQDILKAQVALTRLAEHLIHFEKDADVARVRLNTLLGRNPATPLSLRGDYGIPEHLPDTETLEKLALAFRPDLAQAQAALEKSHQEQALASKAYSPDFTLSGGYMLMPDGTDKRNRYMIEGSINLPWLNHRKHDSEIAEAKAKASEQEAELAALRNAAFGQIQEALAQVTAAKRLAVVYHNALQPQAEATLRSTLIAYENDRTDLLNLLDSQTSVVDIDLAYFQALADFETQFADLELAVGTPINQINPPTTPEVAK
ncbi:MAG TPA: TolC family protein [Candidatus Sulfotelmatobacter sp.]|nr:TolC family protein [Candidatus Sulfotelmatobacter sp.]